MPHRTLIRGARVVLPGKIARTSVLIEGATIAGVDVARQTRADEVVDAAGLHLLPGVIDDQVHFRDPGLTHKEDLRTGSRACAAGGVTSFLEMPNTVPQTITVEALAAKLALASRRSVVNYGFYMGATTDNLDELCRADRTPGVATPGIKIFIGSSTGNMLVDDQECLEAIFAETTLPITAHCEDESTVRANQARLAGPLTVDDHSRIRDHKAAVTATLRAIDLAERHRHRFHVLHVSTGEEVRIIGDHNRIIAHHDRIITAEACPHHLFFDTSDYARLGTLAQMNPSLKTAEDRAALWRGLKEGAIQIVATDHAPHTLEEKAVPYPGSPSGVPAVEVFLPLMLNEVNRGRCTLADLAAWMCDRPARIWDIVGKGRVQRGYDADLVLVDMESERVVRNEDQRCKSGWSPWHGTKLQGWPVRTWVGGRTVFADGRVETESVGREIVFDCKRGGYWATGEPM
ncbi:MAG: dihydroorotase [Gemmatimonadota bacterium]|nr:dihydroorotase [Gemmatimonadota bacterium]